MQLQADSSKASNFYPRPPRGGRRLVLHGADVVQPISIHALREEGDLGCRLRQRQDWISIHALREEGDLVSTDNCQTHDISIHALREEGDYHTFSILSRVFLFLSTPSARRATYFFFVPNRLLWISIHALREEGDLQVSAV